MALHRPKTPAPHDAIVIPSNTGQITNTNRNLSFSTSTPLRPTFARRCPCPGTPPPVIVPDGGGTLEDVIVWPVQSTVALIVIVVQDEDPAVVRTVLNPVLLCVAVPVPVIDPVVVLAGIITKSAE